jgi:hypothetical protein
MKSPDRTISIAFPRFKDPFTQRGLVSQNLYTTAFKILDHYGHLAPYSFLQVALTKR